MKMYVLNILIHYQTANPLTPIRGYAYQMHKDASELKLRFH